MGLPKPRNEVLIRKLARDALDLGEATQKQAQGRSGGGGQAEQSATALKKQKALRGFEEVADFSGHGELIENQPVHVNLLLYKENTRRDGCFYIWAKEKNSFTESSRSSEQESSLYDSEGRIAFTSTSVMGAEKSGKNHGDHHPCFSSTPNVLKPP